jgi:putative NADH-flavin reductase
MRVAILGAAGKTGYLLITTALERGHDIIGIARTPEKIALDSQRITKVQGDAFDRQSIIDALAGADAVITSIGKTDLRDKRFNLNTAGHENVLAGMRAHGIRRLIPISSIGAAQLPRKGIRRNVYLFLRRKYYGDMNDMEVQVLNSEFNVTVVRAPFLHNGPALNAYEVVVGNVLPGGRAVSRKDLSNFILDTLDNESYGQSIVSIADPLAGGS